VDNGIDPVRTFMTADGEADGSSRTTRNFGVTDENAAIVESGTGSNRPKIDHSTKKRP
jgi:hypothetical protein